jgi:hypothetical protein
MEPGRFHKSLDSKYALAAIIMHVLQKKIEFIVGKTHEGTSSYPPHLLTEMHLK